MTRNHILSLCVCFILMITGAQAQNCQTCSSFNCAFDGITGTCQVACGNNYTYSVGGNISSPPIITGGTLVSWSGNTFVVNWTCSSPPSTGTGGMEVHYTVRGQNRIAEGQVCWCGPTVPPDYCDTINLNCAADGITGPCSVTVGSTHTYSVSTTGTIQWIVNINGTITNYYGASVSITWPATAPYVANVEVKRNGLEYTEGMVCVDVN